MKKPVVKKLPSTCFRFALPLGTSLIMTFLVSGVATVRAIGWSEAALATWMTSWVISWAIAFPTMFFMMPVVRRLLGYVIAEK